MGDVDMALDKTRTVELDHMLRKMGGIVSVFEIRSDPVGNKAFSAFRDLMDVYLDAGTRGLKEGHDFLDAGVKLDDNDKERNCSPPPRWWGRFGSGQRWSA